MSAHQFVLLGRIFIASVSSSTRGRIITLAFCEAHAVPISTSGRRGRGLPPEKWPSLK
ncbi:hypothetical protein [Bosea sp. BIWAKO-01]|uniref:hypothetical protein n=1 Tax=Bosea sp. BIWAKO-01 TaxID=506668 RepID=UPI000869D09D|nr:hypothetical protein [Bosea sp. BIWAKO-01]GAU86071.1 hypothetical protein BIWAKO_06019 [Bosea sp. BIWAKO-01]